MGEGGEGAASLVHEGVDTHSSSPLVAKEGFTQQLERQGEGERERGMVLL